MKQPPSFKVEIRKSRKVDHIVDANKMVEVKQIPTMWADGAESEPTVKPKTTINYTSPINWRTW